ncbi:MAG: gamma-glutamylcyclotransferase [Lentisphaerae bacterium]|jgi:gamma-glutamylcyclotransferase (GGCT)/AIG2-like uncharacterized protein YtfP|nr:gamma-glutamylcyclotransferase [Lentisphaerota bacterium]MBT5613134.1 gamma-glutamylcyclotransferase [Lentisphaerota bacterium]
MSSPTPHITLFVYGTLKRGQWNHDRFCRNAVDIRPATIVGRLYQLPAGFPAVVIPEETILAHGTANPLADARTQAELAERGVAMPQAEGNWGVVHGELITFPHPERDLPPIDRLEGFRPGWDGLYRRALVAVQADGDFGTVWVYLMPAIRRGRLCSSGCWDGDGS